MRLLNIHSLQLEEFIGSSPPPYFILSHRWTGKETSYEDFTTGRSAGSAGHRKIEQFCEFAKQQAHVHALRDLYGGVTVEWVWVDTCCIDKRSSAELSEAINSMFQWYQTSAACFVYMNDVTLEDVFEDDRESFIASSWFLRGWTLQELLAPDTLVFCNARWSIIGCMSAPRGWQAPAKRASFEAHYAPLLTYTVAHAAQIRETALSGKYKSGLNPASIAERLAWAARRQTTRIEDEAYCLLGIFQINMPLLYGEGSRAFLRLQQAIVQQSTDKSIFAWTLPTGSGTSCERLFATSPRHFTMASAFETGDSFDNGLETRLTNRGLHVRTCGIRVTACEFNRKIRQIVGRSVVETTSDVFFLSFERSLGGYTRPPLIIGLARRTDIPQPNQYTRICADDLGQKFEDVFALSLRTPEPEQSFFIDS